MGQTHAHMHTHTSSDLSHQDIHNLFHNLSLFGCAMLTHNLVLGSFRLCIKRLIEKQKRKNKKSSAGISPGQHAGVITQKKTFTHLLKMMTSITAMQKHKLCAALLCSALQACEFSFLPVDRAKKKERKLEGIHPVLLFH